MQLCCHAAAEINRHAYIIIIIITGQVSKQCSYVAMQLRKLKMHILWAKAASNAAMLPCSCGINLHILWAKAASNAAMLPCCCGT